MPTTTPAPQRAMMRTAHRRVVSAFASAGPAAELNRFEAEAAREKGHYR